MSKLPVISCRECVKALEKVSFFIRRQTVSRIVMRRENPFTQIVIPDHKVLDRSTLRGIIKNSGISIDEFLKLI